MSRVAFINPPSATADTGCEQLMRRVREDGSLGEPLWPDAIVGRTVKTVTGMDEYLILELE